MRNATGQIDWNATEEHARRIGAANIRHAIKDAQDTLPVADELDREDGGDRGGYYRDEISVFRKVLESLPPE